MRVALTHESRYLFDKPVVLLPHLLRLRPLPYGKASIEAYALKVEPEKHLIHWHQDLFGNYLARLFFPEPSAHLSFVVECIANLVPINPFDFLLEPYAVSWPFQYPSPLLQYLGPYLKSDESGQGLQSWMQALSNMPKDTLSFVLEVTRRLCQDIAYTRRDEMGVQTPEETLAASRGSCRDSAWLLIHIFRKLGLAARFISGYLIQLAEEKDMQDKVDLHAWVEVYLPGAGWLGIDPTSGLLAAEGHIPLAATPDPEMAAPITGATAPCEVSTSFHIALTRLNDEMPKEESLWPTINALGKQIDAQLEANGAKLWMGGEPTFVARGRGDDPQWQIEADGAEKRALAGHLAKRLMTRFAKGGVLHHGQGKWYPGEILPRWQLTCFFRTDSKPLWQDADLLDDWMEEGSFGFLEGKIFLQVLAENLGVPKENIAAAYEDPFYAIWQESRFPANLDPLEENLDDPATRAILHNVLDATLEEAKGFVLPLAFDEEKLVFVSRLWVFRRRHLFLVPGDTLLGFRLPLDGLPKEECIRTALGVEVKNGKLYIFLPPLPFADAWFLLLLKIEQTASQLGFPVVLCGYEPPRDDRIKRFVVAPDPGVIEVNIHPCKGWAELVEQTHVLYEEASAVGLDAQKWLANGRPVGTGGGNHVTLGGPSFSESPFFQKPDVLASMLTFWQHHPSLSYLFSGIFVGPTSQAPRVDDARHESLYELEIALRLLQHAKTPEEISASLQNLMVDLSGNTHRAEFCIDKLCYPGAPQGMLGVLELRAFEMSPSPLWSLLQKLLVRALFAAFWQKPYQGRLVRWGTRLHERFMLPHFLKKDLYEILTFLKEEGFCFLPQWFDAFLTWRFPILGEIAVRDMHLQLQTALEPWPVLAEDMGNQGTARYVDSSSERIQVKLSGEISDRYMLFCNGHKVPFFHDRETNEKISAVRFTAKPLFRRIHAGLKVDSPLIFDVVDTWSGKVIGGCCYDADRSDGQNMDPPVLNAREAESRRLARFRPYGHTTTGSLPIHKGISPLTEGSGDFVQESLQNPDYPNLLDLRRF